MENTINNKSKFFAQYWDQKILTKVIRGNNKSKIETHNTVCSSWKFGDVVESYLELKPLSKISDEDAKDLVDLFYKEYSDLKVRRYTNSTCIHIKKDYGYNLLKDLVMYVGYGEGPINHDDDSCMESFDCYWQSKGETGSNHNLMVSDLLRSKGYALPFMGLSVEIMIKYGWIKLK